MKRSKSGAQKRKEAATARDAVAQWFLNFFSRAPLRFVIHAYASPSQKSNSRKIEQ